MHNIVKRVIDWNSARYDQQYDHELATKLIEEEFNEWLDANTPVQELDALCDIVYVAIGALWKINATWGEEQLQESFEKREHIFYVAMHLSMMKHATMEASVYVDIIACAYSQMYTMGLTGEQAIASMLAVCDSNDSKAVQKTLFNVKTNIDKGPDYFPPTKALESILCQLTTH